MVLGLDSCTFIKIVQYLLQFLCFFCITSNDCFINLLLDNGFKRFVYSVDDIGGLFALEADVAMEEQSLADLPAQYQVG